MATNDTGRGIDDSASPRGRGRDRQTARITLRLTNKQLDEIEEMVEEDIYPNKSEALRDAITTHFEFD